MRKQGGAPASVPADVGEVDPAREAAGPPGNESADRVRKQGGAPASVPANAGEVDPAREAAGPPGNESASIVRKQGGAPASAPVASAGSSIGGVKHEQEKKG